jgi:predicted transcriptional regulator
MKVILGEFTWQDIIKYQDQNIELEIVGNTNKYQKPKTLKDYKERAARKGRIMALPTHLPYIKEHYEKVSFDKLAIEQIKNVCNVEQL